MDTTISRIIDKAMDGGDLSTPELRALFAVDYLSEESYMIQHAARVMSERASTGKAEVHAQVGVNITACPKNCEFCSFAAKNKIFKGSTVVPLDDIIGKCLGFEADGANAIYLMVTANFKFDEYLHIAREVRAALASDTVLIANVGDFDDEIALALKTVGFDGIYHAVRMGEGVTTGIDPAQRMRTMNAARRAGLPVGSCVEPIGPEHTLDELVEKTLLTKEIDAAFSGAMRRTPIPGTNMAVHGMLNLAQMAHIVAAVKLGVGYDIPGNCTHEPNGIGAMAGANVMWAEEGSNPRDTEVSTVRGWSVARVRELYEDAGWEVLDGPSAMYNRETARLTIVR